MRNQHPWLGDVGQGFRVGRLKYGLASMTAGGTPDTDNESYWSDDGLPWVAIADMSRADFVFGTQKCVTSAGISDKRLQPLEVGSLLYSMYASLGQVAELRVPAVTNQAILGLQFNGSDVYSRYAFWQLKAIQPYVVEFSSSNTQNNLNAEKVGNLPFIFPSLKMQERIANFLDEQTARIDALIAGKERLVDLLSESMDAAIERAVLPETDFKSLLPLKRVVERIITGPFGSALHSSDYVEGGVPVINPSHIINGWLEPDSATSVPEGMAESLSGYRMAEGELVVGRRGEMGRCAVVSPEAENWLCGTGCLLVTVDVEKVLPAYAQLVISSRASREWLSLASVGSTMENLNTEILGRLPGYFPSVGEQRVRLSVANDSRIAHFKLIEHSQTHVSLLREYRSSLISAAVTGQIDINNFQMEAA